MKRILNGVSIVIPVYNELKNIDRLIERVSTAMNSHDLEFEIIFVDDNSTDGTYEYLYRFAKSSRVTLLKKQGKKGKAFSLMEGFQKVSYEFVAMIDADLQYPPEAIPDMLEKLKSYDIVVADRKQYNGSKTRKFLSRTFKAVFGKMLFGIEADIQSGLKVFKREVVDTIQFLPQSGWTFDLEFLYRSISAGYKVTQLPITFELREKGKSHVRLFSTIFDIGTKALSLKLKRIGPQMIQPINGTMEGAGIGYKKQRYITHTTLSHGQSALHTASALQKTSIVFFLLAMAVAFSLNPLRTGVVLVGVLSAIYFLDVLFNLFLVIKSLYSPSQISVPQHEIDEIESKSLPVYSILCPLYKEAHVIPQFLKAIDALDWPKTKLDVILLLEADDPEAQSVVDSDLPSYVRAVIVPPSQPKTKPKACNYGLTIARGEYLVIYDAEDMPDPLQLKKAYLAFQKTGKTTICLQAKLNYYNPHQNLLTRFFTAEYSLWFDVTLTGLQSLNTTIPLGGTSNHFRTKDLLSLQGWDPFNVTEDADLGIRLFQNGYKTAIIDSTTLEEANSDVKNWIRQRSRWIKGYMQTYLVHMRDTYSLARKRGYHALIFHLIVGGKIAFILINPILWLATILYIVLYAYVGPTIELLYPSIIFYMAVTSLIFGNFLFLYYYMIGAYQRQHYGLIKYVFLIPIYWLMISLAGVYAFYQLIFKPHYWEKTIHGLHLKNQVKKIVPELVLEVEEKEAGIPFPRKFRNRFMQLFASRKVYLGGLLLVSAGIIGNFLNFLFNAYLGRVLDFDDYAMIGLIGGFLSFSSILFSAFTTTTNYRAGFFIGKYGDTAGYIFWKYIRRKAFILSIVITSLWFLSIPLLSGYFKTDSPVLFILFGFILFTGLMSGANRGFLYSKLLFGRIAVINLLDPVIKLSVAGALVFFGFKIWTFSAVPFAGLSTFMVAWFLAERSKGKVKKETKTNREITKFPFKFFFATILNGFASVSFISLDIILANHYLSQADAGRYALLSLVGKMVFFLGSLASPFIVPLISREEGAGKNSTRTLNIFLLLTFILATAGYIAFGLLGSLTIPVLYGNKAFQVTQFLPYFTLGMVCYTVSSVLSNYYLVRRIYTFTFAAAFLSIVQVLLIGFFHTSAKVIALDMAIIWGAHFFVNLLLHLGVSYVKAFEGNISALLGLFTKEKFESERRRILIFNWRDTKHKWAGGAEVYLHELSKRWVRQGISVTIFCGNGTKRPKDEIIDGVHIVRRGGFYTVYFWAIVYYLVKFRGKYDVIIDSENGIPFFTPLYSRAKTFLLIHHVHQEVFRNSLRWPFSSIASFLEAKLMPFVYRSVQVITVSPSSRLEILRHNLTESEPQLIYNGVDLSLYKPGKKSKKPFVLYVGRLQRYKSLHVIMKAAVKVIKSNPNVEFIIAGEGEEKKKLIKLAATLGISGNVKFLGQVSEARKVQLFQQAWIFVNPSFMEGWGITTIEAAACRTLTIASDVPGLRDSIKDNVTGLLVKYGDSDEFAKKIMDVISNEKRRTELAENAAQWAQNFTWEKSALLFMDVLFEKEDNLRLGIKSLTYA